MKMNIEPSLQSFMDPQIAIARATFAEDSEDDQLTTSLLLTLAGMGLAKAERLGKEDIRWVRTDELKELEKTLTAPIDLSQFMAKPDKKAEAQMTGSLRLIIAHIVAVGQKYRPEIAENITVDSTLLALAGQGLASFKKLASGQWVWAASGELIDRYEFGKGIQSLAGAGDQKPNIKMDDLLEFIVDEFLKMAKARYGRDVSKRKRLPTITTLVSLEIDGEAITYVDAEGQLAWRASADLRRQFDD